MALSPVTFSKTAAPRFPVTPPHAPRLIESHFAEPRFEGLLHHPDHHRHPKLGFLGRLILSATLALGGMSAVAGRNYIQRDNTSVSVAATQFWADNFQRTGTGVNISYYEPTAPYNNTDKPPVSLADYHPVSSTHAMKTQAQRLGNRILELINGRPDLVQALGQLPQGLDIRIYDATRTDRVNLGPDNKPGDRIGYVASSPLNQHLTLGLTLGELGDLFPVDHEFGGHVLDSLDIKDGHVYVVNTDGLLPGLSDSDRALYIQSRDQIRKDIQAGHSALRNYAMTNDEEFLAVAVEAFFQNPDGLKAESPGMYNVLHRFFKLNPKTLPDVPKDGSLPDYRKDLLPSAVTSVLVLSGSFLLIFGGHALWVRLSQPVCESDACDNRRQPCRKPRKKGRKAA